MLHRLYKNNVKLGLESDKTVLYKARPGVNDGAGLPDLSS